MFLSSPQSTYRQTKTWVILTAILFAGMLAWAIYDRSDTSKYDPWLWGFTAFFALLLLFTWVWEQRRILQLHDEGIRYQSLVGDREIRWEDVNETRYSQQNVNAAAHFGLIGMLIAAFAKGKGQLQRTLVIKSPVARIKVNTNFGDTDDAIHKILSRVNPQLLQQRESQMQAGITVPFGNLGLALQGIVWKKKPPIPYESISKCKLEGEYLRVKAEGKWLDSIAVKAQNVPDIFVFLDMVEKRCVTAGKQKGLVTAISGSSLDRYF